MNGDEEKESLQQFGQRIKAKYAGAYDDKDDADVAERFLRKNPVYAEKVHLPSDFRFLSDTSGYPKLDDVYEQAGRTHNVDPNLLLNQGRQETINFNPDVMYGRRNSPKGARGAGQFMPGTAPRYGLTVNDTQDDRTDPIKSIHAQAKYMRKLLDDFDGNESLALAGYNAGEYRKELKAGRVPNIPETQGYVKIINDNLTKARAKIKPLSSHTQPDISETVIPAHISTEATTSELPISDEKINNDGQLTGEDFTGDAWKEIANTPGLEGTTSGREIINQKPTTQSEVGGKFTVPVKTPQKPVKEQTKGTVGVGELTPEIDDSRVTEVPKKWKAGDKPDSDDQILSRDEVFNINLKGVPEVQRQGVLTNQIKARLHNKYGVPLTTDLGLSKTHTGADKDDFEITIPRSAIQDFGGDVIGVVNKEQKEQILPLYEKSRDELVKNQSNQIPNVTLKAAITPEELTQTLTSIGQSVGATTGNEDIGKAAGSLTSSAIGGELGSSGRIAGTIGGILDFINDLSPTKGESMAHALDPHVRVARPDDSFRDILKDVEEAGEQAESKMGKKDIVSMLVRAAGGAPGDLSRYMLLARLPGGMITGMALDSGAQTRSKGGSATDIAKSALHGGTLGAFFSVIPTVGKFADEGIATLLNNSTNTLIKNGVELATISGGTYTLARVTGSDRETAFREMLVNSAFHLMNLAPQFIGKPIRVRDEQGNIGTVKVEDNTVKVTNEEPVAEVFVPKNAKLEKVGEEVLKSVTTKPVSKPVEAPTASPKAEKVDTPAPEPPKLPKVTDNAIKPLSDYTSTLYRETNADKALQILLHDNVDSAPYFSNTPNLAKGQGTSKGVLIELDSKGLRGQVNTSKPGYEIAYENGEAEFVGRYNKSYIENVQKITITPEAFAQKKAQGLKNTLEQRGWSKTTEKDGSIVLTRPKAPLVAESEKSDINIFAKNKIITTDKIESARTILKKKGTQFNSGLDPESFKALVTIGAGYAEAGYHKFADFSREMVKEFGEGIKEHLDKIYANIRAKHNFEGMDTLNQPEKTIPVFRGGKIDLSSNKTTSDGVTWFAADKHRAKQYGEDVQAGQIQVKQSLDLSHISDRDILTIDELFQEANITPSPELHKEFKGKEERLFNWTQNEPKLIKYLKTLGYDSIIQTEGSFGDTTYGVFDAKQFSSESKTTSTKNAVTDIATSKVKPKEVSSIMNKAVDADRTSRGFDQLSPKLRERNADLHAQVKELIAKDPTIPVKTFEKFLHNPDTAPSKVDDVLLNAHYLDVKHDWSEMTKRYVEAMDSNDPVKMADAEMNRKVVNAKFDEATKVLREAGRQSGQALQARQMFADEDFEFTQLERNFKIVKGREPSAAELKQLQHIADEHKAKSETLEAILADKDRELADIRAQMPPRHILDIAEKYVGKLKGLAGQERERLHSKGSVLQTGIDPRDLKSFAIIGADHLATMGLDFAKWSDKMVGEFGEKIRPQLDKIFDEAQKVLKGGHSALRSDADRMAITLKSQKTRMENRIKELENAIIKRERITRTKSILAPDAELTKLQTQVKSLKEDYNAIFPKEPRPQMTDAQRLQALETRLGKKQKSLQEKIANNDLSETPKRDALDPLAIKQDKGNKYTAEDKARATRILAAQAEVGKIEKRYARMKNVAERANEPVAKWAQRKLTNYVRGSMLSAVTVIEKLGAASIGRTVTRPIKTAIGYGVSKVVPGIAGRAPIEGSKGLWNDLRNEGNALAKAYTTGVMDIGRTITGRGTDITNAYGKEENYLTSGRYLPVEASQLIGLMHDSLKAPAFRSEFEGVLGNLILDAKQQGHTIDGETLFVLGQKAYNYALRAKFAEKRMITDQISDVIRKLDNHELTPVQAIGTFLHVVMPIHKISTNVVAQSLESSPLGLGKGIVGAIGAKMKGLDNLAPEHADIIMRNIKHGLFGSAMYALGLFGGGKVIGSFYQKYDKDEDKSVAKYNTVQLGGVRVPSALLHLPEFNAMFMGATTKRIYEESLKKEGTGGAVARGVGGGVRGLIDEVPGLEAVDSLTNIYHAIFGGDEEQMRESRYGIGNFIAGRTVPGIVRNMAEWGDQDPAGHFNTPFTREPLHRKVGTKTFGESIKTQMQKSIPWWRNALPDDTSDSSGSPVKEFRSGKLSKHEATQALKQQLDSSEITTGQYKSQITDLKDSAVVSKVKDMDASKDEDFTKINDYLKDLDDNQKMEATVEMLKKYNNKIRDNSPKAKFDASKLRDIIISRLPVQKYYQDRIDKAKDDEKDALREKAKKWTPKQLGEFRTTGKVGYVSPHQDANQKADLRRGIAKFAGQRESTNVEDRRGLGAEFIDTLKSRAYQENSGFPFESFKRKRR